ncbi:hypothetical protein Trydic_g23139 [Trypoxylus dichotomus]
MAKNMRRNVAASAPVRELRRQKVHYHIKISRYRTHSVDRYGRLRHSSSEGVILARITMISARQSRLAAFTEGSGARFWFKNIEQRLDDVNTNVAELILSQPRGGRMETGGGRRPPPSGTCAANAVAVNIPDGLDSRGLAGVAYLAT